MKQVNPRIYRTILTLVLGLFLSVGAYAQNITVKGNVKDATGEPVIGECTGKRYYKWSYY